MSFSEEEEQIVFMQSYLSRLLIDRWGIDADKFIELNARYKILEFIRSGFHIFHLTGDEGIMLEVEQYIKDQGGNFL